MLGKLSTNQTSSLTTWTKLDAHRSAFSFCRKKAARVWLVGVGVGPVLARHVRKKSDYSFQEVSFLPQPLVQVMNSGPYGCVASAFIH